MTPAQEERQYAIKSFKSGAKDVMVASGVASKGLDFNDIQHVIIFSMPKEIEDYVHQIGRTGRSGKTGIATTFVNMNTPDQTLLDLKYLLMEAGQKCVVTMTKTVALIFFIGCGSFNGDGYEMLIIDCLQTGSHRSSRVSRIPAPLKVGHSKAVLSAAALASSVRTLCQIQCLEEDWGRTLCG